jgi:hypothetical protein
MVRAFVLAALLTAGTALAAQAGDDFFYSPIPRWQEEPEGEALCAVIQRECPAILPRSGDFTREIGLDELYDGTGRLRGLRVTASSGCPAIDEDLVVGRRRFITTVHNAGQPDLFDYRLETPAGVNAQDMRIVHHTHTSFGLGCVRE